MSDLVENPEYQFSLIAAHIYKNAMAICFYFNESYKVILRGGFNFGLFGAIEKVDFIAK